MKHIQIIATGGTIAGSGIAGKSADYEAGHLDIQSLLAQLPDISDFASVSMEQLWNKDSNDITLADWLMLAKQINTLAKKDEIDIAIRVLRE